MTQKFILKTTAKVIVRCDRDRKGGDIACYINFFQLFAEILNSLNILENEIFALGEMNINILQYNVNLLETNVITSKGKNVISPDAKNYIEFCSTLGLKQLIKIPTRITSNTSTDIDHILKVAVKN